MNNFIPCGRQHIDKKDIKLVSRALSKKTDLSSLVCGTELLPNSKDIYTKYPPNT